MDEQTKPPEPHAGPTGPGSPFWEAFSRLFDLGYSWEQFLFMTPYQVERLLAQNRTPDSANPGRWK